MKRLCVTLLLGLLAGCVLHTPSQLRELQPHITFNTGKTPAQAAQCLGRAAEEFWTMPGDGFIGQWREGQAPGSYEVLITGGNHPRVVADITPVSNGAKVTLWQSPYLAYASLGTEMVKGCAPENLVIRDIAPAPDPNDPNPAQGRK